MCEDLILRPVTLEDAHILFEWRNDPQTRAASHSQEEIALENHLIWFKESLASPNRKLYLAVLSGRPVGTIRADRSEGRYTLSWTVAPGSRRKGVGTHMVSLLIAMLNTSVRAEVKVGNIASIKIAQSTGMKLDIVKDGIMYFSKNQ